MIKDSRRSQKGSLALEFALTLPVFLAIILTGTELVRASIDASTLHHAMQRVGRYVALGNTIDGYDEIESAYIVLQELSNLEIQESDFRICVYNEPDCDESTIGGMGDWLTIKASTPFKAAFGLLEFKINSDTLIQQVPMLHALVVAAPMGA